MPEFRPLSTNFGAEVASLKLVAPFPSSLAGEIEAGMDRYGFCVIRCKKVVKDGDHLAFGRLLGPLMRQKMQQKVSGLGIRLSTDELIDVGNLDENGNIHAQDDPRRAFHKGNLLWHSDVTFDAIRATYSILAAHVIPMHGADTEFADMRGAYAALPNEMKTQIAGIQAEHSIWYSRTIGGMHEVSDKIKATRPPAVHPLVNVNPRTGKKSLYLASHASHIIGMSQSDGRGLLDKLVAHATEPRFVFRHRWQVGDVVIWDNLQTMHRGVPFDDMKERRDLRRVTVLEK